MNSMKRQKDELPRAVGTQYATEEGWKNNSRKNEETEPKQKQCPVVHMTGDGSKVWCCKEQYCFSLVQFSRSVMSYSLRPHELQHARPPCPSPTSGVYSDSRPSSEWCHPAISSSGIPFSSCPQSLPASKSLPMSQLFTWGGQSTGASALASFLPKKSQGWSPSKWTDWISLQSKELTRVFSNTTVQKHQFFSAHPSSQSNSHIHTWPQKNHSLD